MGRKRLLPVGLIALLCIAVQFLQVVIAVAS